MSGPVCRYLLLGMGFSGVLQLAGFVSPGWIRYKNAHSGLWYIVACAETCKTTSVYKGMYCFWISSFPAVGKCDTKSWANSRNLNGKCYESSDWLTDFENGYHPYRPWQIQTTIALLACLIVIISLIMARNMIGARQFKRLTIVAYYSLLSGLLSLVPAGYHADIQISAEDTSYLFPYSLLLSGLGGIIALIISLISLYVVLSKQTTNEPGVELS